MDLELVPALFFGAIGAGGAQGFAYMQYGALDIATSLR